VPSLHCWLLGPAYEGAQSIMNTLFELLTDLNSRFYPITIHCWAGHKCVCYPRSSFFMPLIMDFHFFFRSQSVWWCRVAELWRIYVPSRFLGPINLSSDKLLSVSLSFDCTVLALALYIIMSSITSAYHNAIFEATLTHHYHVWRFYQYPWSCGFGNATTWHVICL
jgi:hypothetical protein